MASSLTVKGLRRQALGTSLFAPAALSRAIGTLGFVQADPIRAPARAQDLILRQRVPDYRAGDLERRFTKLGLEEDFLYAYGFMPRRTTELLHPRHSPEGNHMPSGLAADVLAFVREKGKTHPRDLAAQFGRERAVNGWGGMSKATTRVLHQLHYYGWLRVARRDGGIRIYEAASPRPEPLDAAERARRIVLLVVRILAPISEPSLGATLSMVSRRAFASKSVRAAVQELLREGLLESGEVDGERYLWPAGLKAAEALPRAVRFLAPFDPVVWDRRRFEHLWGWDYRFEAYTPPRKRRFGYYAMPLLWGERIIGWANVSAAEAEGLQVEAGFVDSRPQSRDFRRAFDAEVARMEDFLKVLR